MTQYNGIGRAGELVCQAVVWLNEQVSVVPAQPKSKAVLLQWRKFEKVYPDIYKLRYWFADGNKNLAAICGTGGLLVLDFDSFTAFDRWKDKAGELASTYAEMTARGLHLFYKVDEPITRRFIECEALGLGHLCLVAPSVHPSGSEYKVFGDPLTPLKRVKTSELFSLLSVPKPPVSPASNRVALNKPGSTAAAGVAGHDLLSRIKMALPLLSYASTLTQLKPCGGNGRYQHGTCPFHEDKEPSFVIDIQRGLWRCYSTNCKGSSGGDLVNLYALANSITVHEAIKRLAREVL